MSVEKRRIFPESFKREAVDLPLGYISPAEAERGAA
jgi:hypothetical protein